MEWTAVFCLMHRLIICVAMPSLLLQQFCVLFCMGMKLGRLHRGRNLRLRVFENRVLRGIFGAERDVVSGGWRKLYNEELNDLYCSPNLVRVIKSRRMRWAGHVARMGREERRIQGFGGETGVKETVWEDNIKMDLQEVGCGGLDWIGLAQDRDWWRAVVIAVMNHRIP